MPSAAGASGAANDARVETGQADPDAVQADRERLADEADAAVEAIQAKLDGMKDTLAARKAEAKQLRSDANKGAKN